MTWVVYLVKDYKKHEGRKKVSPHMRVIEFRQIVCLTTQQSHSVDGRIRQLNDLYGQL